MKKILLTLSILSLFSIQNAFSQTETTDPNTQPPKPSSEKVAKEQLNNYSALLNETQTLYSNAAKNREKNWVFIPLYYTTCRMGKCDDYSKVVAKEGLIEYKVFNNKKGTLSTCGAMGCVPSDTRFVENGITLRVESKKEVLGMAYTLNLSDLTFTHVQTNVSGVVIEFGKAIEEDKFFQKISKK